MVERQTDGLRFEIKAEDGEASWQLQHSANGEDWEDLSLFQTAEINVLWSDLPTVSTMRLFRAVQVEEGDPFRKEYLEQRAKWQASGLDSYVFEVRQGFGAVSWHGTVTVVDKAIASFETIDLWPPFFEANPPTIADLFNRIDRAIYQDAVAIDVDWDEQHGYPKSCFIDISELIADEEQSWKVEDFLALDAD